MKEMKKEKMVHHHHHHHHRWRKGQAFEEDEESQALVMDCGSSGYYKRTRPKLVSLLLLSLLSCVFVLAPHLFGCSSTFSLLCKLFSLMGSLCFSFLLLFLCFFWLCFDEDFLGFFCRFTPR